MASTAIIEARQTVKCFGDIRAVDGVDLAVARGEIFGLIGHNGAGKSTLFKMLLGLLSPTSGEIRIDGQPPAGETFRQMRRTIGYLPENVAFYDHLTGLETLRFFADLKGADRNACAFLLDKVGLGHAALRRVHGYSKGMRQRLGLAQALIGRPRLLLLDEPTTGLDPELRQGFYAILDALAADGVGILLSSHALAELEHRADRVVVLRQGRKVADGTLADLRRMAGDPVRILVRLAATQPVPAYAGEAVSGVTVRAGRRLEIICPAAEKIERLRAVLDGPDPVADIELLHASLDDIYAGLLRRDAERTQ